MYWTTGSGYIELNITKKDALTCSHSGDCESDVKFLMSKPAIKRQLNKLQPETLKNTLSEFGCWDDDQLADHETNKVRILWIACCDITEGNC